MPDRASNDNQYKDCSMSYPLHTSAWAGDVEYWEKENKHHSVKISVRVYLEARKDSLLLNDLNRVSTSRILPVPPTSEPPWCPQKKPSPVFPSLLSTPSNQQSHSRPTFFNLLLQSRFPFSQYPSISDRQPATKSTTTIGTQSPWGLPDQDKIARFNTRSSERDCTTRQHFSLRYKCITRSMRTWKAQRQQQKRKLMHHCGRSRRSWSVTGPLDGQVRCQNPHNLIPIW